MKKTEIQTVTRTVEVRDKVETYNCDRCGRKCTREFEDGFPDVVIYEFHGNPDDCVSLKVFREFCADCAEVVEREVMRALRIRLGEDHEDRYWGSYRPDYPVPLTADPVD